MSNVRIIPGVTGSTLFGRNVRSGRCVMMQRGYRQSQHDDPAPDTGTAGKWHGNHRAGINEENIGSLCFVAPETILRDALEENLDSAEAVEKYLSDYDRQMIVTSTDIDILVKDFSDIIADGINKTLHPGIYS